MYRYDFFHLFYCFLEFSAVFSSLIQWFLGVTDRDVWPEHGSMFEGDNSLKVKANTLLFWKVFFFSRCSLLLSVWLRLHLFFLSSPVLVFLSLIFVKFIRLYACSRCDACLFTRYVCARWAYVVFAHNCLRVEISIVFLLIFLLCFVAWCLDTKERDDRSDRN